MPSIRFIHDLQVSDAPAVAELAVFNVAIVPAALGALEERTKKYIWTDESFRRGEQMIRELQMALLTGGMQELIESNRQIYRLLDTSLNGVEYSETSADPLVIEPAIPAAPAPAVADGGLLGMVDELPGVLDAGWFGIGGHKATIADVVEALRVGTPEQADSIVSQLNDILGAAGSTAQIGELVADMFTGAVSAAEEGGIMILLAAGIVGNLAATSALSTQLLQMANQTQRIINTLDGGGLAGPADNLLRALRGTVQSSTTRNVIDAAANTAALEQLDALVAELASNEADNAAILAKLEEIRGQLV